MSRDAAMQTGLEQRLLKALREHHAGPGQKLTVAFSGGTDSLALAAALARIKPVLGSEIILAHVDHGLRATSANDASACVSLGDGLGIPVAISRLELGLRDRAHGIGLEEAGRRERYMALADMARNWGSATLLLAHQANDQSETVLMHLVRGSGIDGLMGMRAVELRRIPWWESAPSDSEQFKILRPFLSESRSALEEYLSHRELRPLHDESNDALDFDRNWIRHQVMPRIIERWPGAIQTMQRSTDALEIDQAYLERTTTEAIETALSDDRTLCTDILASFPQAIAFRVIRRWLMQLGLPECSFEVVQRVYQLGLKRDATRSIEVGAGLEIVVDGSHLTSFDDLLQRASREIPIALPGGSSNWELQASSTRQPGKARIRIPGAVVPSVRTLEHGDRWWGTNRRVTEDLRAAGIHPLLRRWILAFAAGDDILLIPAIYPNMYAARFDGVGEEVSFRWSKRS